MTLKMKALIALIAALMLTLIIVFIYFMPQMKSSSISREHTVEEVDITDRGDRIYFLNTGSGDAILIESEGKFALVDGAEDSDNPRGFEELVYDGKEEYVVESLKKIAGDEKGKVELEFILGTHSHSDHIGGLDTVILDDNITVNKVYVKKYDESNIDPKEIEEWDNREVFEQLMSACERKNVTVIHDISEESFSFGSFTMKFCNTAETQSTEPIGENENAIGLLVEKDGMRAFLAADINYLDGDEERLAKEIGKVNLLKVGHHGYDKSTSKEFVQALSPEFAVVTNDPGGIDRETYVSLNSVSVPVFETGRHSGIVADFGGDNINLYGGIDDNTVGTQEEKR